MCRLLIRFVAVAAFAVLLTLPLRAQSFEVLEPLHPAKFTIPTGVSADGSFAVGFASSEISGLNFVAVRWRGPDVVDSLGYLPGHFSSRAHGISADGTVVVGYSQFERADPTAVPKAFRWTEGAGMQPIGSLGSTYSQAVAVSADGSVVAGISSRTGDNTEAFRWSVDGGIEGLGFLSTTTPFSEAKGVSPDGVAVVGHSIMDLGAGYVHVPFRWTAGEGMVYLGSLGSPNPNGMATDASLGGEIVVGRSNSPNGPQAFRWTGGAMQGLGLLNGLYTWATGVSADGSVVVGYGFASANAGAVEAFIWTAEDGMRSLKEVLENEYGVDLGGWALLEAIDISDDGTTIVGWGAPPEGQGQTRASWRAVLAPTSPVVNDTRDLPSVADRCDVDAAMAGDQCTLRAAIEFANANAGRDSVSFDIDGDGVHLITLGGALPAVAEPMVIDATTQPGYAGTPLVVVNGGGINGDGFALHKGETTIRGLAIGGFGGAGIRIAGPGENRVEESYLGVSADGATPLPNSTGLHIEDSSQNVIGGDGPKAGNLISGNVGAGVRVNGSTSTGNVIAGNKIGTDAEGLEIVANGAEGIYVAGAGHNVIGGETNIPGTAPGNLIGGNAADGVRIEGTPAEPAPKNHLLGNSIGLNADGTAALANGAVGIHVVGDARETLVGGESTMARNVISGNADIGLWIEDTDDAAPALTTVEGNYVGISVEGDALVPNAFTGIVAGRGGSAANVGVPGMTIRGNLVAGHAVEIHLLGRRSGEAIVASNRVGLFANDRVAREAPDGIGILILAASRSVIGEPGEGNVIGGMATGLVIAADTVFVVGNRIGTNPAGTAARPNKIGISIPGRVEDAAGIPTLFSTGRKNVIGLRGTNLPQNQTANVISGNSTAGIRIGETIGLGSVGKNTGGPMLLSAVDGASSFADLGPADSNLVVSNFIGVGAGAIGGIGNGLDSGLGGGIEIVRGTGNQILFNVVGENNIGIILYPFETFYSVGTAISFNSIGVTGRGGVDGTPRPNREWGIAVVGAKRTKIGFDVSGVDLPGTNVIQHNGAEGVFVLLPNHPDLGFRETLMTRNLFSDNGGQAISIRHGSIAGGDIEGVPNAPRLFLASRNAESATIFGTTDEAAEVEMYLSPSCDASGRGEGARFSQVVSATAGERFQVLFSEAADNAASPVGAFVTATATVRGTTTSEFSVCSRIADEDNTADQFVEPGATGIILADLGLEVEIPATAAGSRAPQRRDGGTLYAMRYDLSPAHNMFAGSATSDDGTLIEPDAVAEDRYWTLAADGLSGITYSVCLDVSDLPGAEVPGQLVVVHRGHPGEPWTPYTSTLEGGDMRLCAEGLTAFGDLGIGGESLVNPVPIEPGPLSEAVPTAFALPVAYPNPARGTVTVEVALPQPGEVRVEVYDILGRNVAVLLDGHVQAGTHQLTLNAGGLAAGTYLVHATTPSGTATRRVTVVR